MRTRLIRPEFWADSRMADLPESARLTYIGLWCLADDDGYLRWSVRDIAAELYRYDPPRRREVRVTNHLDLLVAAERVRPLECGSHAVIPSVVRHRIQGGKHSRQHHESHTGTCPVPIRKDQSPSVSVSVSESSSLSGSGPTKSGSIDPEEGWRQLGQRWGKKVAQA